MRNTVAFILSTRHSGSHLLAQLLGSHSRCLSIGELGNFSKLQRGVHRYELVHDYATNPFFAGLAALDPTEWHARIFANSRAYRPRVAALIDNSKHIDWARHFDRAIGFDAVYLHLIRDPRAIVQRWLGTYAGRRARASERWRLARTQVSEVASALFGPMDRVMLRKWVLANRAITDFVSTRPRSALVLYDDLVRAPEETLQRLMPTLGLDFEASQREYGRVAHAGTLKRAYLGASARSLIAPDLRWRAELPVTAIGRIERCRATARYLAEIGMELTVDRLRRLQ